MIVRIGITAGEPVEQSDDLFGSTVQLAARLCAQAAPGQVLVSNVVADLCIGKGLKFSDAGSCELKGFEGPDPDAGGRNNLLSRSHRSAPPFLSFPKRKPSTGPSREQRGGCPGTSEHSSELRDPAAHIPFDRRPSPALPAASRARVRARP